MSDNASKTGKPAPDKKKVKADKRAAALRENLKRRKEKDAKKDN